MNYSRWSPRYCQVLDSVKGTLVTHGSRSGRITAHQCPKSASLSRPCGPFHDHGLIPRQDHYHDACRDPAVALAVSSTPNRVQRIVTGTDAHQAASKGALF